MNVLKIVALAFLSLILFFSLIAFSLAFMVNNTALNPKFITGELESVDFSARVNEIIEAELEDDPDFPEEMKTTILSTIEETEPIIKEHLNETILSVGDYLKGRKDEPELAQTLGATFINSDFVGEFLNKIDIPAIVEVSLDTDDISDELAAAIIDAIEQIEPELKEQVAAAVAPIFDYLLAETDSIDLSQILKDTLLSTDFTVVLIDSLDLSTITKEIIEEEVVPIIPEDLDFITDELLEEAADILEPAVKDGMINSADNITGYLLGETVNLRIAISLEPVRDDLEAALRQAVLDSPPPSWESLPQDERDRRLDDFISLAIAVVPSRLDIGEEVFGADLQVQVTSSLADAQLALEDARAGIQDGISNAETGLEKARGYIGWFTIGYWISIAVLVLLIIAIVAIYHQVFGASLHLGIMFLVIGIFDFVGVVVGRGIASRAIAKQDITVALQQLSDIMIKNVTSPLMWLGIGLMVSGAVLIAVSIVYPRLRSSY